MSYLLFLSTMMLIVYVLLLGQQFLLFEGGLFFLGGAAFYAWGAYASALLAMELGCPPLASIPLAALLCAVASALIGYPLLRWLQGDYLALASLGVTQASYTIIRGIGPGGASGCTGLPDLVGGSAELRAGVWLLVVLGVAVGYTLALNQVRAGRFGLLLNALRADENALAALGFRPRQLRLQALVLSAFCASVAGALTGHFLGVIEPGMSSLKQMILLLCGTLLTGRRPLAGPLAGSVFLVLVPEAIQRFLSTSFGASSAVFAAVQVVYGVAIVVIAFLAFPRLRSTSTRDFPP